MALHGLKRVLARPSYLVLAIVVSAAVLAVAIWLPNLPLIIEIMGHQSVSLGERAGFVVSLLGSIATNFSPLSASYTIIISVLLGLNVALLSFLIRNRLSALKGNGAKVGALGLVSGIFGIGCAACGSLVVTSVLSFIGAGGVLLYLPLGGSEFGILGALLLLWSLYALAKRIEDPLVCTS